MAAGLAGLRSGDDDITQAGDAASSRQSLRGAVARLLQTRPGKDFAVYEVQRAKKQAAEAAKKPHVRCTPSSVKTQKAYPVVPTALTKAEQLLIRPNDRARTCSKQNVSVRDLGASKLAIVSLERCCLVRAGMSRHDESCQINARYRLCADQDHGSLAREVLIFTSEGDMPQIELKKEGKHQ